MAKFNMDRAVRNIIRHIDRIKDRGTPTEYAKLSEVSNRLAGVIGIRKVTQHRKPVESDAVQKLKAKLAEERKEFKKKLKAQQTEK